MVTVLFVKIETTKTLLKDIFRLFFLYMWPVSFKFQHSCIVLQKAEKNGQKPYFWVVKNRGPCKM